MGYEGHIISGELLTKGNERKFIPVIRKGNIVDALPNFLAGKYGIDLTGGKEFENNYKDLVTTLYGTKKKPKVGRQPSYITGTYDRPTNESKDESIRILGIITDEVTVPKIDGTRGSALYKVPLDYQGHQAIYGVDFSWKHGSIRPVSLRCTDLE